MKLMTYNIADGGLERLPLIIKAVQQESPDFLTINEANTFAKDDNKILKEVSEQINLPYFTLALSGEYDYHVAVFSKYPFKEVHKLQPLMRACIISVIDAPLGEISIASLHLTPYSEDLRHPEIDLILNFQNKYDNRILMGDMNSLSQYDNYSPEMITHFNQTQLRKFTSNGTFRFDAIDKILSCGYTDSAVYLHRNKENTVPTPFNTDPSHANMRLDYMFVSKNLLSHVKDYKVIKNDITDKASDHYPLTLVLKS